VVFYGKEYQITKDEEIEFLRGQVEFLSTNYVTGLQGRHRFMQKIRKKFSSGDSFTLVMHDVDGLHEVNRVKGYSAGDSLLREVANDLKLCDKPCAVYHIGGDEFYTIYCEVPTAFGCANTTSAMVLSLNYESVDTMLDAVDKLVSEEKLRSKKRRRDDI